MAATREVQVPAHLYERAERAALEGGRSLEELVASALRSALPENPAPAAEQRRQQHQDAAAERPPAVRRQGSPPALYISEPIVTLVAGLLKGDHTVSQAMAHGDFGLGTLDNLDGEVVVYRGVAYHQSERGLRVLTGGEASPFMTVTWFDQSLARVTELGGAANFDDLQALLLEGFHSRNTVNAVHVKGRFPRIKYRAVCKQPDGTTLKQAAARQAVHELQGEEGDLVGFWTPPYCAGPGLNVPGFHLHYLSSDRQRGGHLLDLRMEEGGAVASSLELHRCIVDMPFSEAFLQRRLSLGATERELQEAESGR